MSISPDTDAIYAEAIDLQDRVEVFEQRRLEFTRLRRDKELELLSNGFLPDAAAEIRLAAVCLRASQILEEEHADLFKFLDEEHSALAAINARNEGIVAAGWAEQFAVNAWSRRLRESDKPKGELES